LLVTRRTLMLGMGGAFATGASRLSAASEVRSEKTVYVGETKVRVVIGEVRIKGRSGLIYFHPHENEHSSAVVTRHVVEQSGGRLVEIRSEGDRLVTFKLKGATYSFDPNRMFTDIGLAHSLTHYGPTSEPALDCARKLRNAVLAELGGGKTPIVAAHNNADTGMSVLSFRSGGPYSEQASKIAVDPKEKPHNFFLVLDDGLFSRLHHQGFNTVLQSPDAPDDGSLAVFCEKHHWTYVNVEAAESDMDDEERMLAALTAVLD
jgi:hypothetical protein